MSLSSREKAGTSSISAPARSMVAGHDEEVLHARRLDAVVERRVVHDHVVDRALDVAVADPEPGRRVALRVEVDHQHPVADLGERGARGSRRSWSCRRRPSGWRSRSPGGASSSRRSPRRAGFGRSAPVGAIGDRWPSTPAVGAASSSVDCGRGDPARREPLHSTPAPPIRSASLHPRRVDRATAASAGETNVAANRDPALALPSLPASDTPGNRIVESAAGRGQPGHDGRYRYFPCGVGRAEAYYERFAGSSANSPSSRCST